MLDDDGQKDRAAELSAQPVPPGRRLLSKGRTRTALIGGGLLATAIVTVVGIADDWFGLRGNDSRLAVSKCDEAVRHDLLAPETARFSNMKARRDALTEDDRVYLVPRGTNLSNANFWTVSGTVESRDRSGTTARSDFACRAIFFDGQTARTSVNYGNADMGGQRVVRP